MPLLNWVEYQAQAGDWDVTIERDNNTSDNPTGRRVKFRFQLDGPNASKIFDDVVEGDTPEIKFFRTARVTIAGVDVVVLRHGMAGHKGVEISGPYEHGEKVRAAILAAGAEHGLRQGGTKAYFSTLYEQAWIAYPLPAIYTGEDLRAYREWLPADGWEGKFSIAGSFVSSNIEDYYVTPYDLGYGHIVKFDHDFIGREALEELAENPPRKKMTLVWNTDDVLRVVGSLLEPGVPYKYLELPVADYGNMIQRDEVRTLDGTFIGLSTYTGYSTNERKILSLALLDTEHAVPGEEVTILWGEPDGGSRKPRVELHQQTLVRATVAPAPYAAAVQQMMRSSIESSLGDGRADAGGPGRSNRAVTARARLQGAFETLGFEVIPFKGTEQAVLTHVPTEVRLTVTASPAKGQDATLDLAVALAGHGYTVAPHLSARLVRDRAHLADIVARCREAGITGAFVVGGDAAATPTGFEHAHDLLVALHELDHGFTDIGVGGHPEGHPAVTDEALFQALADKAPLATHITTQIVFDPKVILSWARELRRRGIDLPVHVGVPGAVHRQKLLRVSGGLGIGESAKFLKKQQNLLWRFFLPGGYRPDKIIEGLAPHMGKPDNTIAGFHVFTFNDLEPTEAWRRRTLQSLA